MPTFLDAVESVAGALSTAPTVHLASLAEANATIIDGMANADYPLMVIIPFVITDEFSRGGLLKSTTELNFFLLNKDTTQRTTDFTAASIETSIVAPMRTLAREFIYNLNRHEIIVSPDSISNIRYEPVYSSLDAHLYGVFVRATVPFVEGITGCND